MEKQRVLKGLKYGIIISAAIWAIIILIIKTVS